MFNCTSRIISEGVLRDSNLGSPDLEPCTLPTELDVCKLNPDQTEFIVFGNKRQQAELASFFPTDILGDRLVPADTVKNLGVKFD